MQSFKYPSIYLGDNTSFPDQIQQGLTFIEVFFIQKYKELDGEEHKINAELYAHINEKKRGANTFIIFFENLSYMFSFETMEEALDCIQDFRDSDVNAIFNEMDRIRYQNIERLELAPFYKETV